MAEQKRSPILFLVLALVLLLSVVLGLRSLPLIRRLMDPQAAANLQDWVNSLGVWGVLGLFGVQVLQIVVAILPGEPVELAAGTLYGALGGLVICLVGIVIGSATIFATVRRLGRHRLQQDGKLKSKMAKYQFLQNEKKLETLIFLLYFIPGTPKDILVYVCALTDIPMGRFLTLSTLARLPSVLTSTWAGAAFVSGNWGVTLAIFGVTGALGLGGIVFQETLLKRKNRG